MNNKQKCCVRFYFAFSSITMNFDGITDSLMSILIFFLLKYVQKCCDGIRLFVFLLCLRIFVALFVRTIFFYFYFQFLISFTFAWMELKSQGFFSSYFFLRFHLELVCFCCFFSSFKSYLGNLLLRWSNCLVMRYHASSIQYTCF